MKIQSLSVVVPNNSCVNKCRFCVSRMHCSQHKNQMDDNLPFFDLYLRDYLKRLEFTQHNGCNTVMLTGDSEPQQNRKFLTYFGMFMQMMQNPFEWIEMQTTGILLDRNYLRFLRNHVGVNIISLSVSSFDDTINRDIIRMPNNIPFNLEQLCADIKEYDFSLRLSLNMTDAFAKYTPEMLFATCKALGANQVTLRGMYANGDDTPQAEFVRAHQLDITPYLDYVKTHAAPLATLPYGATKYSLDGMSVVVDTDCMSKDTEKKLREEETYKYLILQPDCKLYSQWDDAASLIF